jgi:hypothetical protein
MAVALLSQKRLVIDSFMQHALAAFRLPAVACWVVNKPKVFGYDLHTHIFANDFTTKPELRNSFLSKFNIAGDELEFPYNNETEIFNADDIIAALSLGTTNFNAIKNVKNKAIEVLEPLEEVKSENKIVSENGENILSEFVTS